MSIRRAIYLGVLLLTAPISSFAEALPDPMPSYTARTNSNLTVRGFIDGVVQPVSGAAARWLVSKIFDNYNVKDFGAVCDGVTDDTASFQNAIDVSVAQGRKLEVTGGTCLVGSLNVPTGAFIQGVREGSVVKMKQNGGNWLFNLDKLSSRVTIAALTIDGANLPTDSQSGTIYRAAVSPPTATSLAGINGSQITIVDNHFINIPTSNNKYPHAIMLNGVDGGLVKGNTIDGTGGDSINLNDGYYIVSDNRVNGSGDGCVAFNNNAKGTITGNILSYCHLGVGAGPEGSTTDTDIVYHLAVTGNVFESNAIGVNFGWFGYSGRSAPTNWQVVGNTFRNTESIGVEFDGPSGEGITNASIVGNSFYGTGSSNYDGTYAAVPVDIRVGNVVNIVVGSNVISSPKGNGIDQRAIQINGGVTWAISNNSIKDTAPYSYSRAIALEVSTGGSVVGNTIDGAFFGIIGEGGTGLSSTVVANNNVSNVTMGAIVSGDVTSHTLISNNMIAGTPTQGGIVIPAKSSYIGIIGNLIDVGSGAAIVDNTARWGYATIRSNTIGAGTAPPEQINTTGSGF